MRKTGEETNRRRIGDGPSLALSMGYANAGFYQTGFYSWQDTVYVGKFGNAFFKGGEVAGQTDFFYGFGTAWITNTSIKLRSCGGGKLTPFKIARISSLNAISQVS